MKIRHRIPVDKIRWTDEVTPEYQAEVDRHTARRESEYQQAQKRYAAALARAERQQERAHVSPEAEVHAEELWAIVELRRLELEKYERAMTSSPQSSQHRGRASYRPVPAAPPSSLLP